MKIEVVSAVPHPTTHQAVLSRRNKSIICAGPYEVLPLETCFEPLPSTSALSEFPIECLELSTDERTVGLGSNALLKIADIQSGREIRNLTGHMAPISSLAASKFSVYGWYTGSSDMSWSQWDTRMHPSKVLGARTNGVVRSVALSPGDRFIAVGTDNSIQLFDARQRQYVKQFNCSGHRLEFNPTEVLLSSIGHDRIVRFFCLENLELISQSDAFLDDIQASAFDTHLMIAATNDSINLLTWEPCDILTTVPLKNVEKVVNVSVNGGVELDFICIGETTERLEMRSYSIEELLSYSPSHELSGSIYEEDEDIENSDVSPVDENKPFIESSEDNSKQSSTEEMLNQPSSPEVSSSASSPVDSSSQSSPSSPTRPVALKIRSASQKVRTASTASRISKPVTTKTTTTTVPESKLTGRSVTPVSSKPPSVKSQPATHPRSGSVANSRYSVRSKPSPSMNDLRNAKSSSNLAGSTQSLASDKDVKKRSTSTRRNDGAITITYLGRPRTPSESEVSHSSTKKFEVPKSPVKLTRRNASPSVVGRAQQSETRRTPKKVTPKKEAKPKSIWHIDGLDEVTARAEKRTNGLKFINKIQLRRGRDAWWSKEVRKNEDAAMVAIKVMNAKNDWSLNACDSFLGEMIENVLSCDDDVRNASISGIDKISSTMLDRLIKFSKSNSRIGVDVAAEERADKANKSIEQLREMCKKRDWYYKQLDGDTIERLDAIFERLKVL